VAELVPALDVLINNVGVMLETRTPAVQMHMVAFDRGVAYLMAWSKTEGLGLRGSYRTGPFP